MLVFPEIQISEGKVVTRASPAANNVVHPITPYDAVHGFEAQGAERLHLLDVDAALGKDTTNAELIVELIASTTIPVQVAGGMRTLHHIEEWFDAGAAHVVLGTLAITDQQLLAEACARFPGAILANIATKDGYVMIDGWRTQTAFRPQDIVYDLQMAGVAGIIHFDINRFEGDASTSLALTMEMNQDVVIPVYSSGTVHSLDDMARLRYLPNIHGVIIGEALINERFSLQEALHVAAQRETSPEPEVETAVSVRGIQHPLKVYLASYGLSPAVRWWNHDLRQAVTDDNPYVEMVIPQEDLEIDPVRSDPARAAGGVREGGGRRGCGGGGARRHRPRSVDRLRVRLRPSARQVSARYRHQWVKTRRARHDRDDVRRGDRHRPARGTPRHVHIDCQADERAVDDGSRRVLRGTRARTGRGPRRFRRPFRRASLRKSPEPSREIDQMKIGFCLPHETDAMGGDTATGADVMRLARRAEEVGFDSVWLVDHFCYSAAGELEALGASAPPELAGLTYGAWECMVTAGALARETRRVEIGTLVVNTGYRNPALLARMADTIDELSGGRLILGLGAGDFESEHVAFGYPWDRRVSRFEEALQIIRPLLRGEKVTFEGEFYTTREAENIPRGPTVGRDRRS